MIRKSLLAFVLWANLISSQTISGLIINSETKDPIPYVNISYLKTNYGTSTDLNGNYEINISKTDTIFLSSIGYNSKKISLKKYSNFKNHSVNFYLEPSNEVIEEVIISTKKKKYTSIKKVGSPKKGLKIKTTLPFGYEFSNYIKNPYKKKGKIQTIIISLNKQKKFDYLASYNIKFYEYDPVNNIPGELVYNKNMIVTPKNKTYKMKVNVDSLSINFPKNGICIGLETINRGYKNKIMSTVAPKINFTNTNKEILTWSRHRNKEWSIKTTKSYLKNKYINAYINLEVKIEK